MVLKEKEEWELGFSGFKKDFKRKRSLSDSVLVKNIGINCIAFTNSKKVYKYQISGMAHNKEVFVRRKCQFRKEKAWCDFTVVRHTLWMKRHLLEWYDYTFRKSVFLIKSSDLLATWLLFQKKYFLYKSRDLLISSAARIIYSIWAIDGTDHPVDSTLA